MGFVNLRRKILLSLLAGVLSSPALWAQTRPIAIVGGMLIDGTGSAAVDDAVIVFQNGRIQEVGKRGEVLARNTRADDEHIRLMKPESLTDRLGVRGRREALVDPVGHNRDA